MSIDTFLGPERVQKRAGGYRTVLFGDSMTETEYTIAIATTASYSQSTGVLTITYTAHQQATGWYIRLFNRSYASLLAGRRLQVTRVDANTFTVQLDANLSGLPNGALTGSTQMRFESWKSAQGFVQWFQSYSGHRFNIVHNGAQSGDTTANALARIGADCLAYRPDVVIMQMPGINDTSSGNGPVDEETIFVNQKQIINAILKTGARLILLTITPVATGEAAGRATLPNMERVIALNRRIKAYCQEQGGNVVVFDAWARIIDPTNATGLAAASTYLRNSTDSVHYSMRGGERIGRLLWSAVSSLFPAELTSLPQTQVDAFELSDVSMSSVSRTSNVVTATATSHGFVTGEYAKIQGGTSEVLNEITTVTRVDANTISFASTGADGAITGTPTIGRSNNLFANPLLTVLDGTLVAPVTGTEATDTASLLKLQRISGATGAAAASIVARADGLGNNQRFVITAAAASEEWGIETDFTPATVTLPASVKAGRTYIAECEVSLTGVSGSNLSEFRWNLVAVVGGVTYQTYALNGYSDGAVLNSDIAAVHLRTAPMVLPTGSCTLFKFQLVLRFSAAGTALTVDFGRAAIRETDLS